MPGRYEAYNPLPAAAGGLQLGAQIGGMLKKRGEDEQMRELYQSGVDMYSPEAQSQIGAINPAMAQEFAKTGAEIGLQGAQTGKMQQDRQMAILGKTVPWALRMGEGKPTNVKRQLLKQIMPHIVQAFGDHISPEQANIDQFDDATIESTVWPNAQKIAQQLSGEKFTRPIMEIGADGKTRNVQYSDLGGRLEQGQVPGDYAFDQDPYGYTQALDKRTGTATIAGRAPAPQTMPQGQPMDMPQAPLDQPAMIQPQSSAPAGRMYSPEQKPSYQGDLNSVIDQLRKLPANHPDRPALQQIVNDTLRQNMARHRQEAASGVQAPQAQEPANQFRKLPPAIGAAAEKTKVELEIKDKYNQAESERKFANDLALERERTANDKSLAETRSNLEVNQKTKAQDLTNSRNAEMALPLLDDAEKLIPKSTGSAVGAMADRAAGTIGVATEGSKNISKLQIIGNKLVAMVPRFEGPQSNYDVQLYKEAAGDLANPEKPVENRLEALKTMRDLLQKYAKPSEQGQRGQMSPDDIKSAYQAGKLSREQAAQMLRDTHGFK